MGSQHSLLPRHVPKWLPQHPRIAFFTGLGFVWVVQIEGKMHGDPGPGTFHSSTTQKHNLSLGLWLPVKVAQSCLFATPWAIQSMEFFRPEYWSGWPFPSPGDLPNPGIKPRSPALQADSLPAELPGKPKNTGVGSLSLLQQIFPTLESNWGLLHSRWILYQLSYQRSP